MYGKVEKKKKMANEQHNPPLLARPIPVDHCWLWAKKKKKKKKKSSVYLDLRKLHLTLAHLPKLHNPLFVSLCIYIYIYVEIYTSVCVCADWEEGMTYFFGYRGWNDALSV